jgi:hypothetical protein
LPAGDQRDDGDRLAPDRRLLRRRHGAPPARGAVGGIRHVGQLDRARLGACHRVDLERRALLDLVQADLRARLRRRLDGLALELLAGRARAEHVLQHRRLAPRLGAEPLQLLGDELVLEPRHDVEVDDPDRPGHDQGEDERQAVPERPQRPRHRHSSSVSRKR